MLGGRLTQRAPAPLILVMTALALPAIGRAAQPAPVRWLAGGEALAGD